MISRPGADAPPDLEEGRRGPFGNGAPPAEGPTLRDVIHLLAARWRTAAVVGLASLGLAVAYLLLARPVYRASVMLQVDERPETWLGETDHVRPLEESRAETEMQLLRSRAILGAVATELGLDLTVRPREVPILGRTLARLRSGASLAAAPWGLASFAWGGERIHVERLVVRDDLLDVPLELTALGPGQYRLEAEKKVLVDHGSIGQLATAGGDVRGFQIVVTELVARPGTRFEVMRRSQAAAADELARELQVQESGGGKERTGLIEVALEGNDPNEIVRIVNGVATTWMHQHVESRRQALASVEGQLAALAPRAQRAEQALSTFQRDTNTVNLSRQAESLVDESIAMEKDLSALELQRAQLSARRLTERHPDVLALERRKQVLLARRAELEQRMRGIPETELESARRTRQVKIVSDIYDVLLARAQQLRLAPPGALEGVRVIDAAIPARQPARPKPAAVLAGGLLFAVMGGIGAALARHVLNDAVDTPDDVERHTGVPVYVAVPHSPRQRRVERTSGRGRVPLLAVHAPTDPALEALRSLRTVLDRVLLLSHGNVIAVASPAPGAGKSFVAANLAVLTAQAGRKVLLVDADLRRGMQHQTFDAPQAPGLTDAATGAVAVETVIQPTTVPGLDLLSTGAIAPNPSELLAGKRLEEIVAATARLYDVVVVDTAPVLVVADGALAASRAGVTLLVLRAGRQSMREIRLSIERLERAGSVVQGAVLNDVRAVLGAYGLYGRRYQYGRRRTRGAS